MIYDDSVLVKDNRDPSNVNKRSLSMGKLKNMALKYNNTNIPICFDIESWWLFKSYSGESVKKYLNVIKQFRIFNESKKVGFYGVLPYSDIYLYQYLVGNKQKDWMAQWNGINNGLSSIAKSVDIAYPSCYTRGSNKAVWFKTFLYQVNKIKALNPNLPIYVFIWPQFYSHDNAKINNTFIGYDMWKFELEMCYKYADGIVIWSPPYNLSTRSPLMWNSKAPWWIATQDFIKSYNLK